MDFKTRKQSFLKEYEKLVRKYNVFAMSSEWITVGNLENNNDLRTISDLNYDEFPNKELTPSVKSEMIEREIKRHMEDLED